MQRSPYRATNPGPGRWWASHGYIFVGQLVRERGKSSGDVAEFGDYSHDIQDGYDAVEWAAKLPGANGKVGMIGHSDEGRLVWFAAVSAPPHLAAIAPSAATSDPWRIVPYAAMAFGPINVDWVCLMRGRNMATNTAELDIGEAITHLPLSTLPQRLGCGDVAIWDRWIAHPTLDAYWRAHAATTFIDKVNVPALSLAGWHDDSRGPLDYTDALLKVKNHPAWHLVMGVHAHKGVDYVAGDYGPQARYEYRDLQLRWFDHYLLGRDNGVDKLPPVDIFVQGDNTWRQENEWPLKRAVATKWYVSSGGAAQTSAGNGVLDTLPPRGAGGGHLHLQSRRSHAVSHRFSRARGIAQRGLHRAECHAPRCAGVHVEAAHQAARGHRRDVGDALGIKRREGHRLGGDAARCVPGWPCRAGAGRLCPGAVPPGDGQGGAAGEGPGREVRHRPLVHVQGVRARSSTAGEHLVGAVPQVRPEPEHRREQRTGLDLRGRRTSGCCTTRRIPPTWSFPWSRGRSMYMA